MGIGRKFADMHPPEARLMRSSRHASMTWRQRAGGCACSAVKARTAAKSEAYSSDLSDLSLICPPPLRIGTHGFEAGDRQRKQSARRNVHHHQSDRSSPTPDNWTTSSTIRHPTTQSPVSIGIQRLSSNQSRPVVTE